jgi:hypothetical protein
LTVDDVSYTYNQILTFALHLKLDMNQFRLSDVLIDISNIVDATEDEPCLFIFVLDEFQFSNGYTATYQGSKPDVKKETLMSALGRCLMDKSRFPGSKKLFFYPIVVGTYNAIQHINFQATMYSVVPILVSLLNDGVDREIVKKDFKNGAAWLAQPSFRMLLLSAGSIPRALEVLDDILKNHQPENCSSERTIIFRKYQAEINAQWSLTKFLVSKPMIDRLLYLSISGIPVEDNTEISESKTIKDLKDSGILFLRSSFMLHHFVVNYPFVFAVILYNAASTQAQYCHDLLLDLNSMESFGASKFEDLVPKFFHFRLFVLKKFYDPPNLLQLFPVQDGETWKSYTIVCDNLDFPKYYPSSTRKELLNVNQLHSLELKDGNKIDVTKNPAFVKTAGTKSLFDAVITLKIKGPQDSIGLYAILIDVKHTVQEEKGYIETSYIDDLASKIEKVKGFAGVLGIIKK